MLLFTLVAAILAGILFGIAPAWQVSRLDRFESLKEGGRPGAAGLRRQHLRAGLVIGEVALALVLLVGAGLFLRSLARLQDVSPGFDPRGVMTATLSLPDSQYHDDARRAVFFQTLTDRLAHLPGVTSAAIAVPAPFTFGSWSGSFEIEGRPSPPGDPGPHGNARYVTPDYFTTLKIPLRRGRWFTDQDRASSQPVMIIDENLARQYWPNEDPVGKHMRQGAAWSTIIGVAGHVMHSSLEDNSSKGTYYYAMYQQPTPQAVLLVRTGDPVNLANPIRDAVLAVDPGQPVHHVRSMESAVLTSLGPRRFIVTLLGFFAAMALLLAVLGLYGVISFSVTQRRQEIGIRMALGAQRSEVLGMVVGQGMRLAGIGAAIGFAGSIAFSRLLHSQLFAVSTFDPLTFAATAGVLVAAALLASYIPAMRATRVDPMDALRYE